MQRSGPPHVQEALQRAVELMQRGAAADAQRELSAIVAQFPDNSDAHGLLGVALAQQEDFVAATKALQRAIEIDPTTPSFPLNLGNVMKKQKRFEEAIAFYRRAIALRPDSVPARRQLIAALMALRHHKDAVHASDDLLQILPGDVHAQHDRGLARLGAGDANSALSDFEAVSKLRPDFGPAWTMRGEVLLRKGQFADAISNFQRALSIDPADWDALSGLGSANGHSANFAEAIDAFNRALQLRPDHAQTYVDRARIARALNNNPAALFDVENALRLNPKNADAYALRAAVHRSMGKSVEALADCERSLEIAPDNWSIINNRGVILDELGRSEEALAAFERALVINPNSPDIFQNLGTALAALKRGDDALRKYDTALKLDPSSVAIYNCKGAVQLAMRRFEGALASFDRAAACDPKSAISQFHRAFPLLAMGHMADGFKAYEWRRRGDQPFVVLPKFEQPELSPGDDVRGKTVLLSSEQGLGDIVQYARFARSFTDRGAKVVFAVYPALLRLMKSVGEDVTVVPPEGPAPAFDVTCPLLSAPYVLGTTLDSIPASTPYLFAPPELCQSWRARLEPYAGSLRVGLAWSGNAQYPNDWTRSIAFEKFRSICDVPDVRFISVQKDVRAGDEDTLAASGVVDVRHELTDFADTAALVSELDLVITVDTSIGHLAGALGKTTWVLLSAVADWRWLEHRSDSPWYPTVRLFRQSEVGAWESVFSAVKQQLVALSAARRSSQ